ncbi:MAG: helix-turn-helix transcriptional regulator [bacterium]|nr:helix-turn-helix transcriptional regulator [bacterium]
MGRLTLGEFEELVLLIVAVLNDNAYGVNVMEEILKQTGRKVNISAVHTALDRLENKSLLSSHLGGATKTRGGRRKRFFTVTKVGLEVIQETRLMRDKLYGQISSLRFGTV